MGLIFADGGAVDQVQGQKLVLWDGRNLQTDSSVRFGDKTYVPVVLDPMLEQVLPLPTRVEFGRDEECIAELQAELIALAVDESFALLTAIAILATWLPECLRGPTVIINPWGFSGTESALLEFMGLVCRRAIRLAEPSIRELVRLPASLAPTLLLSRPGQRTLTRLITAVSTPGICVLYGGKITELRSAVVVCTTKPMRLPALSIPLAPAAPAMRHISGSARQAFADRFQPRLLGYRLEHHLNVANSQFDAPAFCPEVRLLAQTLGAVLEGAPALRADMMVALRSLDEQHRGEQSQMATSVVLEALFALCHSEPSGIYIGAVTDLANSMLENGGEAAELSPRRVGQVMREEFGLCGQRRGQGYELALDRNTRQHIHLLAGARHLLEQVPDCPQCQQVAVPSTNATG
jgi:hypothetical protein